MSIEERIDLYLEQILQRLTEMSIDQLEREVLILEEESGGFARDSETSRLIERQIRKLVASLLNHTPDGGTENRDEKPERPNRPRTKKGKYTMRQEIRQYKRREYELRAEVLILKKVARHVIEACRARSREGA